MITVITGGIAAFDFWVRTIKRAERDTLQNPVLPSKDGRDSATDAKRESDRVSFDFDHAFLSGKNVLIVDNSMQTGRTLRMLYDEVSKNALHTRTLVLYRRLATHGQK